MVELRIKAESPPERCEVCHQADCFDAQANYCARCACIDKNKFDKHIPYKAISSLESFGQQNREHKYITKIKNVSVIQLIAISEDIFVKIGFATRVFLEGLYNLAGICILFLFLSPGIILSQFITKNIVRLFASESSSNTKSVQ